MDPLPGKRLVVLFLFLFSFFYSPGQDIPAKYHADLGNTGLLGINCGPVFYQGDLDVGNFTFKRNTGLALSLFGEYHFSNPLGLRIQLLAGNQYGGIRTFDINGTPVEESFESVLLEGNLQMVINFSNLIFGKSEKRRFFVYGTVGLGYAGWYAKLSNQIYDLDSLQYKNPLNNFNAAVVIPAGIGVLYRIGNRLNLGLEYNYKTYMSDKMDNITGGYPYDVLHYLSLNISFNLGTGIQSGKKKSPSPAVPYQVTYPSSPRSSGKKPELMSYPSIPEDLPPERPPSAELSGKTIPEKITAQPAPGIYYAVQILSFTQRRYTSDWIRQHYHIEDNIRIEKSGSTERILVGHCTNLSCAQSIKEKMIKHGFRDAFIVNYKNGVRQHFVK